MSKLKIKHAWIAELITMDLKSRGFIEPKHFLKVMSRIEGTLARFELNNKQGEENAIDDTLETNERATGIIR